MEKCTEPNVWCDVCGFDVTGCTGEAKPAVGGKMAISGYSGGTVYVHLTLKAVDVSGNEVSTTFNSYIDQDVIDNREGYGADFYVGDTYCLSGFDIDGYTVKDEEITFTVYSSGNISINSGNASVEYGSDTTYIVIPVNCIGGDRVTIDCSTIDLNVNPYHAWGPGWYADGSVDLHELILTEPYIFILENSESMTKDNVEYIRILGGAILEAGTLADGVLVYAENGKIQSGTFISHVNVYADGEICGGTFNNVVNKGIISAGTFNGELTNYGTITNQGNIQLGEDFVLVQNGNVDCNAHIWRDGICRLCSVTCQHSWTNGTCTVCDLVCGHSGGTTKPTDNGNGTHSVTCTVCGGITEVHTFDENGTCDCGVNLFTVSGSTLTIDGTLGGKTEATEEDITVLVNKIKECVDSGITTIIVPGSEPTMIDMGNYTTTAIGEAIYCLSGSGAYDENNPYNGKIDLVLPDVTEIVAMEFYAAFALNSITLPKVTTIGDMAFQSCDHLTKLTFGSVLTTIDEHDGLMFWVGEKVDGCDLFLNCGQMNSQYVPDLATNTWTILHTNEFKSITLTHTEGTAATCIAQAVCSVCGESYGEVGGHTPAEDATYTDNGDGTHSYTCTDCKETVAEDHTGGTATCTTLAVCTVCGVSYGDVDTTNHDETVAFDSNGFCPKGCYEPATDSDSDGVYEIGNAGQLYWFAAQVNSGEKSINAVLMHDIDLTNHTWTPIGVTAMGEGVTDGYTGTFDGQGHVISNITFATPTSAMAAGIFGTVQSGGTVKNLGVENLTFDNNDYDHRAAGIAGQLLADSTISDCYVINSTVKASSRVVGGIVGMNKGTVKNCYTYNMTLAAYNNRFGGISGDYSGGKLENCYTDYSALASSQAGTATNCEAGVSAERFASGEVAYLLGDPWGQTIGTDTSPNFTGGTVYQVTNCKNETVYSNTNETIGHSYENGICTVCGGYEPATDSDSDGYYEITNAGQLYWFAQQVNSGSTAINGELTADIVVNENVLTTDGALNGDGSNFRVWTPIGNNSYRYTGEFRGNEHTVSGLYFNGSANYVGLFGYVGNDDTVQVGSDGTVLVGSGGTVQNVGVIDSYLDGGSYVGGVVGYNDISGTVQYVYNTGNIQGSSQYVGGVVGRNQYIVRYAYNTGTVFAQNYAGGVVGHNNYILEYAYNTGSASDWYNYYVGVTGYNRDSTKLKNCYYLADSETDELDGTTAKTAGQFEIGEVAYLLGSPFGQNIGTHVSPVLNLGYTVYQVHNCKNDTIYSNTNANTGHIGGNATCTAQAVCTVCGASYGELAAHSTTAEDDIAADCNNKAYCSVCQSEYGEVDTTNHDETVAFNDNGFCPNGCYEPAVLNGEDYEISNAGQLYWFVQQVNGGNNTINAILTADIDLENRPWTPIGTQNESVSPNVKVPYMGVFDGQGHVIKNLSIHVIDGREAGLFGRAQDATLLNFGVVDAAVVSDPVNGTGYRAGIVAGELHRCTVANVYSTGNLTVTTTHAQAGGIAGECADSTLTNCFTTYGCLTASNAALPTAVTNCYYLASSANADSAGTFKTGEQFESGEVAYLLGDAYGQTIGTDEYPVLGGAKVYPIYNCSGELSSYTNTQTSGQPQHTHGTPAYTWTEDPTTLTVTVSCTACGETFTGSTTDMDSIVTSDDGFTTTYTATVTLDRKYYTDSKVVSNEVTSVNITWGEMDFTYTDESGWNTPDTAWVQVENTGNTDVSVTYDYVTERTDITGSFFDGTSTVTAPVAINTESTKKIWLRLDGTPSEALNNTTIGSVKLTIE